MKKLLLITFMAITYSMSYGMYDAKATAQMFEILRSGNHSLDEIARLLESKANPNALDETQFTPLYYATKC